MPERGEVWQVDFGIAQKVRPALVVSIPYADSDRALLGVIPHTSATRGSPFEVPIPTRFLSEGAFLVQGHSGSPAAIFLAQAWRPVANTAAGGGSGTSSLALACPNEPQRLTRRGADP